MNLEQNIEAVLFYKAEPVPKSELLELFGVETDVLDRTLDALGERLQQGGIRLIRTDAEVELATAPETMELIELKFSPLFQKIKVWIRDNTRATPFLVDGERKNVPMRLGKKCFSWINTHPGLYEYISVDR